MRFLLDQNISPKVADVLRPAGHDVTVAREVGPERAAEEVVISTARLERRVLVSADTDFGTILARTGASTPSFLLMRRRRISAPPNRQSSFWTTSVLLPTTSTSLRRPAITNNCPKPP